MLETESRHSSTLDQGPSRDPWLTMDWTMGTDASLQDMLDCDIKSEIDSVIGGHPELGFNFTDLSPLELDEDPVGSSGELNGWFNGGQSLINGNSNSSNRNTTEIEELPTVEDKEEEQQQQQQQQPPPQQQQQQHLQQQPVHVIEMTRRDYRVAILYDFRRGLTANETYNSLKSCFGENRAPALSTVMNWYRDFKKGRCNLDDEPRRNRNNPSLNNKIIGELKKLLEDDPRASFFDIKRKLNIFASVAQNYISDFLQLTKYCLTWVPRSLTNIQRQARLDWCRFMIQKFGDGTNPELERIVSSVDVWLYYCKGKTVGEPGFWSFQDNECVVEKKCVVCYFSSNGLIATVTVTNRRILGPNEYINECLVPMITQFNLWFGNTSMILHHDDAPAHSAVRTLDFLGRYGISSLPHPPNSPDLTYESVISKKLWDRLYETRFSTHQDAIYTFTENVDFKNKWKNLTDKWLQRIEHCVQTEGNYIDNL